MAEGEGEEAAKEPPVVDFNVAEVCATAAVSDILDSCAQQLFKSYIQRRAFPYTAERVSDLLMKELRLSFVRHDRGEDKEARLPDDPPEEWGLEPEPPSSTIDSWARSCVPVRKKYVRSKDALANARAKGAGIRGAALKVATSPEGAGQAQGLRGQAMALTEERDEDEEEAWMREMKEKEAKRKREDEARMKRKAAEEAEEAATLSKVKGDMQHKPFAYDTDGNIIWVTPMASEKLPNPNPSLNFKFKGGHGAKDAAPGDEAGVRNLRSGGGASAKRRTSKQTKKKADQHFTDGFQRLTSQQPPMLDAMHVAPGVVLGERGRLKKGEKKEESKTLSRKDYQAMLAAERQSGVPAAGSTTDADAAGISMTVESSMPDPQDVQLTPAGSQQALSARGGPEGRAPRAPEAAGHDHEVEQDFGGGGLSAPAGGFVPQRPAAPPPAVHNPRGRREAIGWRRGERERVPTSGAPAAGFRNYFPPPPMGATMGHGLLPKSPAEREKEFFFPDEEEAAEGGDSADDEQLMAPIITKRIIEVESPKSQKMGGSIQAPNRDLLKRLFR